MNGTGSNMAGPFISICIPAYKNVAYLRRLLESIREQDYTAMEVVVTDDSPDDSVKELVNNFQLPVPLRYIKNADPLGTPENWNESIRQAKGEWIKMMHNDDWFASPGTLSTLAKALSEKKDCRFFFSAFQNITEKTGNKQVVRCTVWDRLFLKLTPLHLFKRVYVGNPSCTLIRKDIGLYYDNRMKFVVDFEYYIRCIRQEKKYHYIDDVLVNVGFHDEQVTGYTKYEPAVQVPENVLLLEKLGSRILRNPVVYDYYWRLFRNLNIQSVETAQSWLAEPLHPLLQSMIRKQSRLPVGVLRIGALSKVLMTIGWLRDFFKKR